MYKWSKGWKPDVFISLIYKIKTTFQTGSGAGCRPSRGPSDTGVRAGRRGMPMMAVAWYALYSLGPKEAQKQGGGKDLLDF